MNHGSFENSEAISEIRRYDFSKGDLECKVCRKTKGIWGFSIPYLVLYIKKLTIWRTYPDSHRPRIICVKCYNPNPHCHFTCPCCNIEMAINRYPKTKRSQEDDVPCLFCVKIYKYKKHSRYEYQNSESSYISCPSNTATSNLQPDSYHDNKQFNSSHQDIELFTAHSKRARFGENTLKQYGGERSNIERSNFSSHYKSASINQNSDSNDDNLIIQNQLGSDNSSSGGNSTCKFQLQEQRKEMKHKYKQKYGNEYENGDDNEDEEKIPQSHKAMYIPKFNTNIHSLLQLLGRKNPQASTNNYNSFTEFEDNGAWDCNNMGNDRDQGSADNQTLNRADSNYSQHGAQNLSYNYSNIESHVHKIASSVKGCSNNQFNGSNNDNNTNIEETLTTFIGTSLDTNQSLKPNNGINKYQGDVNDSVSKKEAYIEKIDKYDIKNNQISTDIPSANNLKTIKTESWSHISHSNDSHLDVTMDRYRNKNFELNEISGKSYNQFQIQLTPNNYESACESDQGCFYKSDDQINGDGQDEIVNTSTLCNFNISEITSKNSIKRDFSEFFNS